jgi:hypothetical protein
MNKQQQRHDLYITFMSHVEGKGKYRKPAPIKRKKKAARPSLSARYQQVVNSMKERMQIQFQQAGQLFFSWKVRH